MTILAGWKGYSQKTFPVAGSSPTTWLPVQQTSTRRPACWITIGAE